MRLLIPAFLVLCAAFNFTASGYKIACGTYGMGWLMLDVLFGLLLTWWLVDQGRE